MQSAFMTAANQPAASRRGISWVGVVAAVLFAAALVGCGKDQDGSATGISGTGASVTGDGGTSTAGGGQGAGATGTQGDAPADNPASEATEQQQKDEQ
ncbi:MAG TPA: hypothetical protein VMF30_01010 [Pirellulales bacterium]|nr:hypothetical protein [Pirellulales bacterium]